MSTLDADLEIAVGSVKPDLDLTPAREARVGDVLVRRLLPLRQRRSVGAWCFVDHYGPMSVGGVAARGAAGTGSAPHPSRSSRSSHSPRRSAPTGTAFLDHG